MQQQVAEMTAQLRQVETEHDQLTGRNAMLEKVLHSHQRQLDILHDQQQVPILLLYSCALSVNKVCPYTWCLTWATPVVRRAGDPQVTAVLQTVQKQQSVNPQWQGRAPTPGGQVESGKGSGWALAQQVASQPQATDVNTAYARMVDAMRDLVVQTERDGMSTELEAALKQQCERVVCCLLHSPCATACLVCCSGARISVPAWQHRVCSITSSFM